MQLLESPWFFQMVEKQGKTPADRLVAVFKVIDQWIAAPGIREALLQEHQAISHTLYSHDHLKHFLADLAAAAKAADPAVLANQLVILLQGAITEELRNPGTQALQGAGEAARAVVACSCGASRRKQHTRLFAGGLAASLMASIIGLQLTAKPPAAPRMATAPAILVSAATPYAGMNPDTIDAVLVLQQQIEKGICPAPQLLAMPQGQVTAYMNVIHFRTPENPAADRANIRAFLEWFANTRSSECYMPPANGHTTVAWVSDQTLSR